MDICSTTGIKKRWMYIIAKYNNLVHESEKIKVISMKKFYFCQKIMEYVTQVYNFKENIIKDIAPQYFRFIGFITVVFGSL